MDDIISQLEQLTGLTTRQLAEQLSVKGNVTSIQTHDLKNWRDGNTLMPGWVERVASQWIIEIWQDERARANAGELWEVDTKYTRILGFLTMGEIATMVKKVNALKHTDSPSQ